MNKMYIGFGALLLIIFGGYLVSKGRVGERDAYTIGVVAPLTGDGANLGTPYTEGMRLAADEINASGGINGKYLHLAIEDGKLDGTASITAARHILAADNPDSFVVMFHAVAQAVSPVLQQEKIPLFYEAYTRSMLQNPYAFKGDFDSKDGCQQLLSYAKDHHLYKAVGALMARAEYSDLCIAGLRAIEPDLKLYQYTFGETDFRSLLAAAKRDGVDTLVVLGIDPEPVLMFKQLSELKYPIKIMCVTASECIYPAVVDAASATLLEGTYGVDFLSPTLLAPFAAKFQAKYPNASYSQYAWGAVGYEAVTIMTAAFKECLPDDRACVAKALNTVSNYTSVIDSHGFKDRILQLNNKIYQYRNGGWVAVQ